jgi:hypothetical protein
VTFIDQGSGVAMTIQIEPTARDAGAFWFRVPGMGIYEGNAGSGMSAHSPRSVTVKFDGTADLIERADPNTEPSAPAPVTVRLLAQIDPVAREAEATLFHDGTQFHLNTRTNDRTGVPLETLAALEAAIVASDWAAVHPLMNSDIQSAYSVAEFAAHGAAEEARAGHIEALRRRAVSDPFAMDNGALVVVVTYDADLRTASGFLSTTTYDVNFIAQMGEWKIWYSVAR